MAWTPCCNAVKTGATAAKRLASRAETCGGKGREPQGGSANVHDAIASRRWWSDVTTRPTLRGEAVQAEAVECEGRASRTAGAGE